MDIRNDSWYILVNENCFDTEAIVHIKIWLICMILTVLNVVKINNINDDMTKINLKQGFILLITNLYAFIKKP